MSPHGVRAVQSLNELTETQPWLTLVHENSDGPAKVKRLEERDVVQVTVYSRHSCEFTQLQVTAALRIGCSDSGLGKSTDSGEGEQVHTDRL